MSANTFLRSRCAVAAWIVCTIVIAPVVQARQTSWTGGGIVQRRSANDNNVTLDWDLVALGRNADAGPVVIPSVRLPNHRDVDLELERFRITTSKTEFVRGRRGGADVSIQYDPDRVILLRGRVIDQPGSRVFLALSDTGSTGSIDLGAGARRFAVTSVGPDGERLAGGRLAVYESPVFGGSSLPVPMCGLSHGLAGGLPAPRGGGGFPFGRPGPWQIELAVETDYEFFQLFGDLNAAGDYVVQVYGAVSDIYVRDVGVRIDLAFVRLWDDPNDLFNEPDPLVPFRDYWNANMTAVDRDVAQFFSGRRDLPWGGVAWLNGLCNNLSYSVAGYATGFFADPSTPSVFNRDVSVTAHEIGHNCGTPHTHDLGIDTCNNENSPPQRGTIMSYCGQTFTGGGANTDLRFHAIVQDVMAAYIGGQACVVADCNGNGNDDADDVLTGTSPDVNNNGVPDECEDCNGNGTLDDQDILSGFSPDLNGNGIPDECEPDCNGNGIPDDLDFRSTLSPIYYDDFEQNTGWTVENLGATSGDWERGVPVNDPGWAYDPTSDSDDSGQCYLTQNELGNTDVDGGAVRLTSPLLDLSAGGQSVGYDYFLRMTNAAGVDRILVEANDDDGIGPWLTVAIHGTDGGLSWRSHVIDAAALAAAGVNQTDRVRLRFTVNDDNPQTIVEGGIDAFFVGSSTPPVSLDQNGNNIPDECEPDCDNDGVMDYLQIQADMSLDLNRNVMLDACEDCDGDGTTDLVELDHAHNVWIAALDHTAIREYLARVGALTDVSDDPGIMEGQDLIVTPDRRIFVSSKLDHRVVEFDVAGAYVGDLVSSGAGGLSTPAGLIVTPGGNLLVSSVDTNSVLEYDGLTGAFVGEFVAAGAGGLVAPFGLTFGPNGNLFVTSNDNQVLEFDGPSGAFVGVFVHANDNGGLTAPRGLLFLPTTGNLLVASYGTDQVLEYDAATGAFVRQFNQGGTVDRLTLDQPWSIRLGPDGDVYVSRANDQESAGGIAPLHLTNARIYHFDVDSGWFMRAYILGVDSGILNPTGFDFVPDTGLDCNLNLVQDDCDIASGLSADDNGNGVPDECESTLPGDMNCDAVLSPADIPAFVLALIDPAGYAAAFPDCFIDNGDMNGDDRVDGADVPMFVASILN